MLNPTGINLSNPLTKQQLENYKIQVSQELNKPEKYRPDDMIIQPDDNEDWITSEYNHGHTIIE